MIGEMLHEKISNEEITKKLIMRTLKEGSICDNVTVIFILFKNPFEE